MLDVLITGVGGQGTVLAAKVLAQAAEVKGWQVRTAETIGMAQRGGFVTSHVRMGNEGEAVYSPLLAEGTADLIIALEPAEAARSLPYLKREGLLVTATSAIEPVSAQLSDSPYEPAAILASLQSTVPGTVVVDDVALCATAGSRKVLNLAMLAVAVEASRRADKGLKDAVSIDELKKAVTICVKERFIALNCSAIDKAVAALGENAERPAAHGNGI